MFRQSWMLACHKFQTCLGCSCGTGLQVYTLHQELQLQMCQTNRKLLQVLTAKMTMACPVIVEVVALQNVRFYWPFEKLKKSSKKLTKISWTVLAFLAVLAVLGVWVLVVLAVALWKLAEWFWNQCLASFPPGLTLQLSWNSHVWKSRSCHRSRWFRLCPPFCNTLELQLPLMMPHPLEDICPQSHCQITLGGARRKNLKARALQRSKGTLQKITGSHRAVLWFAWTLLWLMTFQDARRMECERWHLSQDDQLSAIFHHGTQTAPSDTWILIWSPKPLVSCLSCLSGGQRVLQAAWADGFGVRDSVSNYPLSCTTVWLCAERKVVLHSFLATSRIVLPFCKVVAIHIWGQCVG